VRESFVVVGDRDEEAADRVLRGVAGSGYFSSGFTKPDIGN
jgi:hypothetical protein